MEIYKFKADYARMKEIHIQTANKRLKNWTLQEVTINNKKVWYLDIFETNLILATLLQKKW